MFFKTDHLDQWRIKEIEEGGYWIIPSHRNSLKSRVEAEPVRYWSIEITLTSGEVGKFYVKARTKQDAILKAKEYAYVPKLGLKGEWRLLLILN